VVLLLISALVLLGIVRSDDNFTELNTVVAALVGVVLPALFGVSLLRTVNQHGMRSGSRAEQRRRAAIESEVLRLAMLRDGMLTAAEVAEALALSGDEATAVLDGLVIREVATVETTGGSGMLYRFPQVKVAPDRHSVPGLLDG